MTPRSRFSHFVFVFATLAAGLIGAPASQAATWHVRTDGHDSICNGLADAGDPGSGAIPRPCAFVTPQRAVDVAGQGDTVLIHAGTYSSGGDIVSGRATVFSLVARTEFDSEGHRLTIRDAGDGPVVFDGQGTLDTAVIISNTCFITVEGIEMKDFTADTGSLTTTWGAAGVKIESTSALTSSFIVLRSLFIHDATLDHLTGQFAEIAADCDTCEALVIDDCTIDSFEPSAIALGVAGGTFQGAMVITDNKITHARSNQLWTGLRAERTDFGLMQGNFFQELLTASSLSDEVLLLDSTAWNVIENVFYLPAQAGLHIRDDFGDADTMEEHFVVNNVAECGGGLTTNGLLVDGCTNCEVRNNLATSCGFGILIAQDSTGSEFGFNGFFDDSLTYGSSGAFGFAFIDSDVTADPLFSAVAPRPDPFYRLLPASPMIDAGSNAFCGSVPSDGHCDIGRFQSTSAGNNAPATPSILFIDQITGKSAVLHGSAFSDPDPASDHQASQWQVDVAGGLFLGPVVDSGTTTQDLTSFKAGGLAALTAYDARVRYRDDDGNWSAWSSTGPSFTTLIATAIPPKVVSVTPADGAKGVVPSISVVLTFNVPVAAASLTTSSIQLTANGVAVPQAAGSPLLDGTETIVTIVPSVLLTPNVKYKVVVKGGASGVVSRDGGIPAKDFKSSFTVENALVSSNPADGATGVATSVTPMLTFSAPMDAASATTSTVTLTDKTSGSQVSLSSVTVVGAVVTATPAAPLTAGHKYKVTVTTGSSGLKFNDGRLLVKKVVVTFKT